MRYYGTNSQSNTPMQNQIRQEDDFPKMTPMTPQNQTADDKTYNRSSEDNGIYKGQQAQNVRQVDEWLEKQPQSAWPPGSNPSAMGFQNATVYDYPASYEHMELHNSMEKGCPSSMTSLSFLCSHRGKAARVELGDGLSKSGMLVSVNDKYIVLEERGSGNHIMCLINAIKAIDLFMGGM